jgi:hypothetical protein
LCSGGQPEFPTIRCAAISEVPDLASAGLLFQVVVARKKEVCDLSLCPQPVSGLKQERNPLRVAGGREDKRQPVITPRFDT